MGLFNLNELSQASDNDILNLAVESADVNVSVPGGLSEKPDVKEYNDGYTKVDIPSKTTISADTYNEALSRLKQSFKEAYELMDTISNAEVITESVEDKQQKFVEAALDEAFYNSYMEGPIFESVNKADKDEVKEIVKKLKNNIESFGKLNGFKFKKAKTFLRLLLNADTSHYAPATDSAADEKSKYGTSGIHWLTTRFWQVLGVVYAENQDIKTIIKKLNEEMAEYLNGYNILYSKSFPNLYDIICDKFGWKTRNCVYFLIVDKKKKIDKSLEDALKEADAKVAKDNNSSEVKTESCEFEVSLENCAD